MYRNRLLIFNPEHDLALAVGKGSYTPPAEVVKIKRRLSLLPALYARNSDFIIIPDDLNLNETNSLPFSNLIEEKDISLIHLNQIDSISHKLSQIIPWGWDFAIYDQLKNSGIPHRLLPSDDYLDNLRILSHRRTAILFRKEMESLIQDSFYKELTPQLTLETPNKYGLELFEESEVDKFLQTTPQAFFKAPWSSSGRGIVCTSHISREGLMEWVHGVIKKQGSVIAEPAWEKCLDFATEWWIDKGHVHYLGLSLFNTSSRGKYHGNLPGNQDIILKKIKENAPAFNSSLISLQKDLIDKIFSSSYNGPLGIDMLADNQGRINACVEINLRLTMGMINLPDFEKFMDSI
ncbi:MAG: hypothetical protein J1F38_10045 [Muribaculaceae bacterium]|nr:hypothetical protein [Muribaculaceae bacterium]